ncbi:hypothetical protein [Streptomyces sp. NPDC048639]|uniref:hypothetical protein n=1 Tax=Streptomyces sp. NPDC048639 TaxID=3365581 RepID=UPI0037135433
MHVQRTATAAMVVLAVSGLVSLGAGSAFADDPQATAGGGSTTSGDLFQQNVAQDGRQNNNCSNINGDEPVNVTGGRLTGRCVTGDGSVNKFADVHNGPADAAGGGGTTRLPQQNIAQRGRQNNNCLNANTLSLELSGGRLDGRCADQDLSRNEHTHVKGGGATANGGTGTNFDVQQVAQEGRQNNNCASPNYTFIDPFTGSRIDGRCGNKDGSVSKRTWDESGGAEANGGEAGGSESQSIAQDGRQNNNCASSNGIDVELTGGRLEGRCGNKDTSVAKRTWNKGGGAEANGGSTAVEQQNVAQEGRQNNNCANPNDTFDIVVTGGRAGGVCGNQDSSVAEHTWNKGGGASANGGSDTGAPSLEQQNIAQEGRQNNNCSNPNDTSIGVTGGRAEGRCWHKDASFSKHTLTKGGGAEANGGSGVDSVEQQNVAQAGRQNNNCANSNEGELTLTGGRVETKCGTVDRSASVKTAEIGGGAEADGGSSTADLFQQNTAQEGRQSNSCGNPNNLELTVSGGRATAQCQAVDTSRNIGSVYR